MSRIEGTLSEIMTNRAGEIWYNFGRGWKQAIGPQVAPAKELLVNIRKKAKTEPDKAVYDRVKPVIEKYEVVNDSDTTPPTSEEMIERLIQFFSEFHFEPNFRFINTLAHSCREGINFAKSYVVSYFELTDSPYTQSLSEKMKSHEFKSLIEDICSYASPSTVINRRFKLYYGSQGTGKTVTAEKETDDSIVCHSAMLPSDIMEDFKFDDGKPGFHPSSFYHAVVEGKKILLDEINLLPFDSLRFLQGILDGKESFTYKGNTVRIHPNFMIVGTMNLVVNGCTYSLPAPLIDRASELRKFKLSAKDLVGAIE